MTTHTRQRRRAAFTMIELTVASVIVGMLAVGSLAYQYHASRDVRRAEAQAVASRLAKTVLDQWRGLGGVSDFNPLTVFGPDLTITASNHGPAPASEGGTTFTLLGNYRVRINDDFYFVTCSWLAETVSAPRLLNIAVGWRADYADAELGSNTKEVRYSVFCGN